MTCFPRRRSDTASEPRDHYADVTAQIIAALEAGTPPWRRP
jgi:antirestriction protein ArdC